MSFDAVFRVYFDENAGAVSLNAEITTELGKLDREAARIRKAGGDPRQELAPSVEKLRGAIGRFTAARIREHRGVIERARLEHEKQRAKNSTVELFRLHDARSRVAAMSDAEAVETARDFVEGSDVDRYVIRELVPRLQAMPIPETPKPGELTPDLVLDGLRDAIRDRHTEQPWLQEPKAAAAAAEAELLESLKPGRVLVPIDNGQFAKVDINDLVDFDGELDAVEPGHEPSFASVSPSSLGIEGVAE